MARRITIILNPAEQVWAEYVSRCRRDFDREKGRKDMKISTRDGYNVDLQGYGAELAFCAIHNLYPCMKIGEEITPVHDCFHPRMGRIDVKAATKLYGPLIVTLNSKGIWPDGYALMVGKFPQFTYAGWIDAQTLVCRENYKTYKDYPGMKYIMEQKLLWKKI